MNQFLGALTAASVVALAAAPAAAQGYGNQGYGNQGNNQAYGNQGYARGGAGIENRIARLEARVQAGVQAGTIDRAEARALRQQLRDLSRLERQYSRNGLSQQERADLQQRVRAFRDDLAAADGRGNGQYGQYGDDGYYGQGGPYEEAYCENNDRGGLGGIIDGIFGGNNDRDERCSTLRVGQRASANLGAVPYQYRSQYRDGGGVYYRSDGRSIYQIDARTNTVLRIYDMNR